MATIAQAVARGMLHDFRLPEHDGRIPRRRLYVADCFYDWVDNEDQLYIKNWQASDGGRTRFEHLVQALSDFCCDERPLVGDLNRVTPTSKGICKIQPRGVRVFGWVPSPHQFVVVRGALASETHGAGSIVKECVEEVIAFAKLNGLNATILRGDRLALFPPSA